jgi:hypothetical protein
VPKVEEIKLTDLRPCCRQLTSTANKQSQVDNVKVMKRKDTCHERVTSAPGA